MKSQLDNSNHMKPPLEYPSIGSLRPSYSTGSRNDANMKSPNISPPDTYLYQDDPNLQNFNQQKYDADSYDTYALPNNYAHQNLSQGFPEHMMHQN